MAYNENLANRIRERLSALDHVEEKKMMGGLTFMYNDKMCVGIIKDEMMCRVDPALHNELVEKQGCTTMMFTTKPMMGYVLVDETAMRSKKDFEFWINLCLEYNKFAKSSKKKKSEK